MLNHFMNVNRARAWQIFMRHLLHVLLQLLLHVSEMIAHHLVHFFKNMLFSTLANETVESL